MGYELKLTVEQIVAAIGLLDEEEQASLRLKLISWLAGVAPLAPLRQAPVPQPDRAFPSWLTADELAFAEEEELYLFDELTALGDE